IARRKFRDHFIGHTLFRRPLQRREGVDMFYAPDGDVFAGGHLIAHEILEYDANLAVEVVQVVFAQVDSIEQNLSFHRVIKTGQEFGHRRLSLTVFADQSYTLSRPQNEIQAVENEAGASRIAK